MLPGSTTNIKYATVTSYLELILKTTFLDFTKLCVLAPKSHHLEDIASEVTFDHRQIK